MAGKIREVISFSGRVQGVGFRYRLRYLASNYGVTGWVRNEYDGSVTAEMQGLEESIDRVIQKINEDWYIRVDGIRRKKLPLEEQEYGFHVRY